MKNTSIQTQYGSKTVRKLLQAGFRKNWSTREIVKAWRNFVREKEKPHQSACATWRCPLKIPSCLYYLTNSGKEPRCTVYCSWVQTQRNLYEETRYRLFSQWRHQIVKSNSKVLLILIHTRLRHFFYSIRNPKLETTGANTPSIKPLPSCTRTRFFVL